MPSAQPLNKKISLQVSLAILSGIGALCYIIYKASHTSFTHDESYTYTHYVHQGFMDIISYKTPYLNNHILNTVLMKYSEVFFGSSELALRLPSIIAFITYSVFGILILHKYYPAFVLPSYLLLILNPYLLDFFSLSRGYALSMAFITMSIYYLSVCFTSKKNAHIILFNVAAFLAVMSNFSALNYYLVALILFNAILFIEHKLDELEIKHPFQFYKKNKINIISIVISGMILYEPLRRISKKNLLDFGGKNGFLEDTVSSLIYDLFYETPVSDFHVSILKAVVLLITLFSLILILKKIIQKDLDFFKTNVSLVFINLMLFSLVCITNIQHILLGNDFNMHRFALFFYPLFMLNFIFLTRFFYVQGNKKWAISASVISVCLLSSNLYVNHSFGYYKDWKWDSDSKLVIHKLVLEHGQNPNKQIRLGINWLFEPSTNFYRYTWDLKWLNPTHRRGISKYDDYLYVLKTDKEFAVLVDKPILHLCEETGAILLKNR